MKAMTETAPEGWRIEHLQGDGWEPDRIPEILATHIARPQDASGLILDHASIYLAWSSARGLWYITARDADEVDAVFAHGYPKFETLIEAVIWLKFNGAA